MKKYYINMIAVTVGVVFGTLSALDKNFIGALVGFVTAISNGIIVYLGYKRLKAGRI